MIQKTYVLNDELTPEQMDRAIAADEAYLNSRACLMQVYEPTCDKERIMERMRLQREILPKARIVGMTTLGALSPETEVPSDPMVTCLYFDRSDFDVYLFDCHSMDQRQAARQICEKLAGTEHVKGMLLLTSCAGLIPTPIIEEVESNYPDISIFGAQAGTQVLGNDQSMVFTSDQISDRGVLAVVFRGEDLHIKTDYNLGWQPLGKEMTVTATAEGGFVSTIDGEPATQVYQRYLGVDLDEYFYANVCSFPFLMRSGNRLIARVPTFFNDEGMMQFPGGLSAGTKVTLSYTKPEYLLRNSLAAANEMVGFAPQAVMLFACINRRVYMGNERADREIDYYRRSCPTLSYAYGYGEILRTPEGGELLNSTLVAAGLREGEPSPSGDQGPYADPDLTETGLVYKPLADRLVTFLEETTAELEKTIAELESIAQHDQLTGIFNRRRTDEILEGALKQRRHEDNVALLMYDIDHFKEINDTFGHVVGDMVLKTLTSRVLEIVRAGDAVGRWGGEEFLVVVSNANRDQAMALAERIRAHVERDEFETVGRVTVSVGVTCANEGDSADSIFSRVDAALYDAKNAGRNQVAFR